MAEKNQDLGVTQKQNGDYTDIVIPDLDLLTTYGLQVAWVYADKEKPTSEFSDVFEFTTPGPEREEVTNVVWVWEGTTLKGTWDRTSGKKEKTYQVYLTAFGTTIERSWTQAADLDNVTQTFLLTEERNIGNFGRIFRKQFTGFIKTTYLDGTTSGVAFTTPEYNDPICSGVASNWTVTGILNGVLVSWSDSLGSSATPSYSYSQVYVSTSPSGPWEIKGSGLSPIQVPLDGLGTYYFKLSHVSKSECESLDSDIKEGKAFDPLTFDEDPPNEITINSVVWDVNDIKINATMPATKPPSRLRIFLTNGTNTGFFDKFPSSSTGSIVIKITESELYNTFAEYFTSFDGLAKGVDEYENMSAGVTFTVGEKTNPLTGIVPTAVVTAVGNGYTVSWSLVSGAVRAKVYEGSSAGFTPNDNTNLVYSGLSPALITKTTYETVYVKIKYNNNYGNYSEASIAYEVTPLSIGDLSLIDNPVKIATDGSIFTGELDEEGQPIQSGARLFFNREGIFIYDEDSAGPTTQIVGDASSGSPTFITTNAQIANWKIYENKIENVLGDGVTKYAGLSPNGNYSFWAGSDDASGSATAKFSVTKTGELTARDVNIIGGSLEVGTKFKVAALDGKLTAADAEITGTIGAVSGKFGEVDIGGTFPDGVVRNGQLRIIKPGVGQIEMGRFKDTLGNWTNDYGIQITNLSDPIQPYVQMSPDLGIIARKGVIAGWEIMPTYFSSDSDKVGINAPAIPASTDVAFWAGGPELSVPNSAKFKVNYGGALVATDAKVYGEISSSNARFGSFDDSSFTNLEKGWYVSSGQIISTSETSSRTPVYLDAEWGAISGANVIASVLWLNPITAQQADAETPEASAEYGYDYISSAGSFRLGAGKIRYSSSTGLTVNANLTASNLFLGNSTSGVTDFIIGKAEDGRSVGDFSLGNGAIIYDADSDILEINPQRKPFANFKVRFNITSNEDGTFGDSTVVQDGNGYLTTGRAFQYGNDEYPTNAVAVQEKIDNRGRPFVKGDIWLSTKA